MLLVDRNTAQFSDVVVKMRSFLNNLWSSFEKWFRRNTLTLKSLIKPFTFIALNRLGDFERRMQVCKLRIWNHKIHMYINCILILSSNIVYLSPVSASVTNMGFLRQSYAVIASCKRPVFFLLIIIYVF